MDLSSIQNQLTTQAEALLETAGRHPVRAIAISAFSIIALPVGFLALQCSRISNTLEDLQITDFQITTKLGKIWDATLGRISNTFFGTPKYMRPIFNAETDKQVETALQMIRQANDASSKVSPPNLIIHGEPGVGKTEVIKYMCLEAGVSYICIPPGSLEQHIANGTHIVFLNTVLRVAKESAGPVCLILNDGEELIADRQTTSINSNKGPLLSWEKDEEDFTKLIKERRNALVNAILDLAGMQSNKVFFAVTTNRPHKIDSAFKTRASKFEISAPECEERKNIIIAHLPRVFENDDKLLGFFNHGRLEKMANSTVGFTGRNLVKMLELLASLVTRNGKNIRQDLIDAAILQTRPSANERIGKPAEVVIEASKANEHQIG